MSQSHFVVHQDMNLFGANIKAGTYVRPKEWIWLTDEEIDKVAAHLDYTTIGWSTHEFARAIEAKLKEKNT